MLHIVHRLGRRVGGHPLRGAVPLLAVSALALLAGSLLWVLR